jgi:putative chitinase
MEITVKLLIVSTGCTEAKANEFLEFIKSACDKFEINNPNRVAAFLANVGVESGGLEKLVESMNYSAQRLAAVWPHRFAIDAGQGVHLVPNDLAMHLQHNEKAIANEVYGGRFGNRPSTDDGWNYRGRGLIGTTFLGNYQALEDHLGLELVEHPELLEQPEDASDVAAFHFVSLGCADLADSGDFAGVVKHINGQAPCAANEGPLRQSRYEAALSELSGESVEAPVVEFPDEQEAPSDQIAHDEMSHEEHSGE